MNNMTPEALARVREEFEQAQQWGRINNQQAALAKWAVDHGAELLAALTPAPLEPRGCPIPGACACVEGPG